MRIAVIGDVHLAWGKRDVAVLDAAGYDLALFVGDLAGYGSGGALRVARTIARLRTPALVIPGNHDAVTVPQLASEVFDASDALRSALAVGMSGRVKRLRRALGRVPLCGYSLHRVGSHGLTVLAARPHSIGGPRLAYRRYLASQFGVQTMEDSAGRLRALFDEVESGESVLVLAHCGPTRLGDTRGSIYGCDFRAAEGDWGDPDLRDALSHAARTRKRVIGVVAGHMHHRLRGGGERTWHVQQDGIQHVNAARVPRTRRTASGQERHHVRLTLTDAALSVEPVWLAT